MMIGPWDGLGGSVAKSNLTLVDEVEPSELYTLSSYLKRLPRSELLRATSTYLIVGMFLTKGSLAAFTSILGISVTPLSLNSA